MTSKGRKNKRGDRGSLEVGGAKRHQAKDHGSQAKLCVKTNMKQGSKKNKSSILHRLKKTKQKTKTKTNKEFS